MGAHNESTRLQRARHVLRLWTALCLGMYLGWVSSYYWPIDEVAGSLQVLILQTILVGAGVLPLAILELVALIVKGRRDLRDTVARHQDGV